MKKKTIIYLVSLLLVFPAFCQSTKNTEKVSLEIIDTNSQVINYEIDWPFPPGPKPVGGETSIINVVNGILSDNNIDCPPKREKVSENIWLCGNGKKIKAKSNKLAKLLSKAWD